MQWSVRISHLSLRIVLTPSLIHLGTQVSLTPHILRPRANGGTQRCARGTVAVTSRAAAGNRPASAAGRWETEMRGTLQEAWSGRLLEESARHRDARPAALAVVWMRPSDGHLSTPSGRRRLSSGLGLQAMPNSLSSSEHIWRPRPTTAPGDRVRLKCSPDSYDCTRIPTRHAPSRQRWHASSPRARRRPLQQAARPARP